MLESLRSRARSDERGVVLVMSVGGLVLALVACALSVDIGRQAFEKRRDQSVADMAALDGARAAALDPANAPAAASLAAQRNGFDPAAPGNSLLAEVGSVDEANTFNFPPAGGTRAVRVTVSSVVDHVFAPGSRTVTAQAVARILHDRKAGFSIGSTLAAFDTTKAGLLDSALGQMIGGNADFVGWRGLTGSSITVNQLRESLVSGGVQAGSLDEMLATQLTMRDVAAATARALNQDGDSNARLYSTTYDANYPGPYPGVYADRRISAESTNTTKFKLGDLIRYEQGTGDAVLASNLNAFQLLTATAIVANGTNLVTIPSAVVTVPGVTQTKLELTVLEAPRWVIGREGVTAQTAQLALTVTPALNLPVTVDGLTGVMVTGDLPVTVTGGGAVGTLSKVTCPDPAAGISGGIEVGVQIRAFSGGGSATLAATSLDLLGIRVPAGNVSVAGTVQPIEPPDGSLVFSHPTDFSPSARGKRVGTNPTGVVTTFTQTGTVSALGSAVAVALGPVMRDLDALILNPLLGSLGFSLGVADVTALRDAFDAGCSIPPYPVLVG